MSNIFDMLDNVRELHKRIYEDDKIKRECKSYIANNIAYFYKELSTTHVVEIIEMYKDCFKNGESNISDILKSKNIPYILVYLDSNTDITEKMIEDFARDSYRNEELVESLEYIKLLKHKYELNLKMHILNGDILRELGGTKSAINAYKNAKKLKSLDFTANRKILTTYIYKYKKEIIIVLAMLLAILVGQYMMFNTGIISSKIYDFKLSVDDGAYIMENKNTVAIPIDTTININIKHKLMPFYGHEGNINYKISDSDIALLDSNNNLTGVGEGTTQLYVIKDEEIVYTYNISVIKPEIQHIELSIDRELHKVGDRAQLEVKPIKNYDFDIEDEITYKSTDKRVVDIDDKGMIEVMGAGKASIVVTCGDITVEEEFLISVVLEDLRVKYDIDLEVGDTHKIKVDVITNAASKYEPNIMFSLENEETNKTPVISIDDKGNIEALREGTQIVKVRCSNLEKSIIVTVNPKDITKSQVKNLVQTHGVIDNNLIINLDWDSLGIDNNYEYEIYAKFEGEEKFNKIGTTSGENTSYSIHYDLNNYGKDGYVDIYVVGRNDSGESKKSNSIKVQFLYENKQEESIDIEADNQ